MKLHHLHGEQCPTCGAPVIHESGNDHQHANGEWFEEQGFKCGCTIEWSPHLSREVVRRRCPSTEESKQRLHSRQELYNFLIGAVRNSKADEEYRNNVLASLRVHNPKK